VRSSQNIIRKSRKIPKIIAISQREEEKGTQKGENCETKCWWPAQLVPLSGYKPQSTSHMPP